MTEVARITAVQIGRTVDLLKRIEWNGHQLTGASCPCCGGVRDREGHAADCDIKLLIEDLDGR